MTSKQKELVKNLILGIIGSILATIIISICANLYNSYNSIYGTWYVEESYANSLSKTISFHKDGSFVDGSIGATYSAENGTLILYYNPLYGTLTYQYEIVNKKLYIYNRHGQLYYVYTKEK